MRHLLCLALCSLVGCDGGSGPAGTCTPDAALEPPATHPLAHPPGVVTWGVPQARAALLAAGACGEDASEAWVANAYRWVVWKLAAYERRWVAGHVDLWTCAPTRVPRTIGVILMYLTLGELRWASWRVCCQAPKRSCSHALRLRCCPLPSCLMPPCCRFPANCARKALTREATEHQLKLRSVQHTCMCAMQHTSVCFVSDRPILPLIVWGFWIRIFAILRVK